MKNISELLLERGTSFYEFGRSAIKFCFPIGVVIITLIMMFGDGYQLDYLAIDGYYGFVNFLMVLGYISLTVGSIGVLFYDLGLHYLGLGQIAKNTDNLNRQEISKDE